MSGIQTKILQGKALCKLVSTTEFNGLLQKLLWQTLVANDCVPVAGDARRTDPAPSPSNIQAGRRGGHVVTGSHHMSYCEATRAGMESSRTDF